MRPKIRLAIRDWDYVTPLALGDVRSADIDLEIVRVGTLPDDLATDARFEAAEISFGRYARARARGVTSVLGVPHFPMRGFRHRCIITTKASDLTRVSELAGKRIGVTGWPDSGNVWTRAVLRRAGVAIDDVRWFAGRLTQDHPTGDRLAGHGRPGRIEAVPGDRPMMDLLHAGELDAVFTPFMPPGFFGAACEFRQLIPDFRRAELDYFNDVGYVPAHHLLGIKPELLDANPRLAQALGDVLDESVRMWRAKRMKYADTTPWLIDEIRSVAHDLPESWEQNGYEPNEHMIDDFAEELYAQKLTSVRLRPSDLFPGFT